MSEIPIDELARRLGEVAVLDVRSLEEFEGTLGAPCDPRQGHIPGAVHLPLEEMMLLDEPALRSRLGLPAGAEVVAYCHSGARSGHAVEILDRLGYRARNYRGSWHEWSRSEHPAEATPEP